MKLKVAYGADEEKRRDRLAGFGAAIVVNFGLVLATNLYPDLFRENSSRGIYLSFLPLLVNALFLVVTLIILPQFTLGYLMAVAIAEVIYVLSLAVLSAARSAAGFLAAAT